MKGNIRIVHLGGEVVNGYLLVGEKIAAVDIGFPSLANKAVKFVRDQLKRPLTDLDYIFATHYHFDHIAGIPRLLECVPGAQVYLPAGSAGHVERSEPLYFPPPKRWHRVVTVGWTFDAPPVRWSDVIRMPWIGLPFLPNSKPSFDVAGYLHHGQTLPGFPGFKVIYTPGHSNDSVCFYHAKSASLLTGDTVIGGKTGAILNPYYLNADDLLHSGKVLSELKVKSVYPGHGNPIEGEFRPIHSLEETFIR